jgi:uncharacterized protein (DUF2236 family)
LSPALRRVWPLLRLPGGHLVPLLSLGLLPPVLRDRLGVEWTTSKRVQFQALTASMRAMTPVLPERIRISGPRMLEQRADAIATLPFAPRRER